jgi:hypothetical protein
MQTYLGSSNEKKGKKVMGYTHFWYQKEGEYPLDQWRAFVNDFKKLLPHFEQFLEKTGDDKLTLDDDVVCFNGKGDESCETFIFQRKMIITEWNKSLPDKDYSFNFCKTGRRDYDIAVCCSLILAKSYFNDLIVKSDGDESDWDEANYLCKNLTWFNGTKFREDRLLIC